MRLPFGSTNKEGPVSSDCDAAISPCVLGTPDSKKKQKSPLRFDLSCRARKWAVRLLAGGVAVDLCLLASLGLRCGNYELLEAGARSKWSIQCGDQCDGMLPNFPVTVDMHVQKGLVPTLRATVWRHFLARDLPKHPRLRADNPNPTQLFALEACAFLQCAGSLCSCSQSLVPRLRS